MQKNLHPPSWTFLFLVKTWGGVIENLQKKVHRNVMHKARLEHFKHWGNI